MLISTKKENSAERGWGLGGGVLGRAAREGAAPTPGPESIGRRGVASLAGGIFYLFIYLLLFFWLCWVFVSVRGLSLVAASGGHSSSRCAGLSLSQPSEHRLQSAGSVVVAHGLSCSAACGIFPDQGSNPCPLHWQAGSQPLRHQGSPISAFYS